MTITKANTNDVITVTDSGTGITGLSGQFNVVAGSLINLCLALLVRRLLAWLSR